MDAWAHHQRIAPGLEIEHLPLAQDAAQFIRVAPGMTVIVHPVVHSQAVETGHQIQKHPHLSPGPMRPPQEAPEQAPGIPVHRKPTVTVRLAVE